MKRESLNTTSIAYQARLHRCYQLPHGHDGQTADEQALTQDQSWYTVKLAPVAPDDASLSLVEQQQ